MSDNNTNQVNTKAYDDLIKEVTANDSNMKTKMEEFNKIAKNLDNGIYPVKDYKELSVGQQKVMDDKIYEVKGSMMINDKETGQQVQKTVWVEAGPGIGSGYRYVEDDGTIQKVDTATVDRKLDTKSRIVSSGAEAQKLYNTRKLIVGGSKVKIDGNDYTVTGYIVTDNGQKRAVYSRTKILTTGLWYIDSKGNVQELRRSGGISGTNDAYYVDGKWYSMHSARIPKEAFEPSDEDKKVLGIELTGETSTEAQTEPTPDTTPEPRPQDTNKHIKLEFSVKRMEYKIRYNKYGDKGANGTTGPYKTKEARQFAIDTYNLTPGHGKKAEAKALELEKYIKGVRVILEDALELSPYSVKKKGNILGRREIQSTINQMDELVPTIFKTFAAGLQGLIDKACKKQKAANKEKYNELIRYQINPYISGLDLDDKSIAYKYYYIKGDEIIDYFAKYYGYLTGKENVSASAQPSKYQTGGKSKSTDKGIYVNVRNTKRIINDCELALKEVTKAKNNVKEQVNKITAVAGYTANVDSSYRVKYDVISKPLLRLENQIKGIKRMYEDWLKLVKKYSGSGDGGSGGSTKTTPKTTPKTETPTVAPTETPTEQPTERPTEEVTQPTTPPTSTPVNPNPTPSGGDNSNGGGGNYSYTGDGGGETVTEAPTTVTEPTSEDVIVEGNSYKLPTSSKPATPTNTTTNSGGGNSAIPVLAGLAAAAAAGIGAKAYIDRKNNRDNEEDGEFKAEDWSGDTDMSMEYQEPEDRNAETLDYDEPGYQEEETERYGARSNQDMENLQ